ncbi:GAF domain-containing sensor histidine kinase [Nocardioides mesophilus]|uniref:GAF domain-containing protein n=1 Tax=Nocardioides mesophilus TaxID=433659 RepID=A0A7G9R7E6_9ACTN|nr:GAF domain-containing sensor histidine kinase [Nocardioides mesophilus]QNN51521.1 GAF domain-containing protein [Nocardioides mesophilus]
MTRPDLPANVHALLDAVVAISTDLDPHSVLDRIVAAACQITGARYGALGVVASEGGLSDFITHGLTEAEHRAIGPLPRGLGLLGHIIDHPEPLRLRVLKDHPQSAGFPQHHPVMTSFLGVPVRVRGTVFGNLYLTDKQGADEFTDSDEMLVEALATAAGSVIDNARNYARNERRRQWLAASEQILAALQPPVDLEEALSQVAIVARRVTTAAVAAVVQRSDGRHSVVAADGPQVTAVAELVESLQEQIDEVETNPSHPVVTRSVPGGGHCMIVPLRSHLAAGGVLLVYLDRERGALERDESELLLSFADQAGLALDRAQAMADREELMLVADRDRIARDLHDLVIQRLFATGLQLQGLRRRVGDGDVRSRIDHAVADLDVTIRDIRSTIFELQHAFESSLRADVRGVVKEYVPVLGFSPLVRSSGPVDTAVPQSVAEQLLAVLRESLSNVARHAEANAAVVEVEATEDSVWLRVTDNGRGLPGERHESGLRNVRRRARDLGGEVRLLPEEPHGTRLEWRVPFGEG